MVDFLAAAVWIALGLLGGASLVIQAGLNSGLRERLQSVSWAGFVSYLGGTVAMLLALALTRDPLHVERARDVPPAWWLGGFFGAAYLCVAIVLLPRLGAATLVVLIVAGQLGCSILLDHFGLLGVPVHPLDGRRVVGALFLIVGVMLIRL
jgi:transporter family-2 protein